MFETPIIGIVLSGGNSSRMGFDKSLIQYHDRPQSTFLFDLLSCYCSKTFLSVKNLSADFPSVEDDYPFGGPLNGILTSMTTFPGSAVLTVPCDMPEINATMIKRLLGEIHNESMVSCFINNGLPEPLFTLWKPAALSHLLNQVASEDYSPMSFIKKTRNINLIELPSRLRNINTQDEQKSYFIYGKSSM